MIELPKVPKGFKLMFCRCKTKGCKRVYSRVYQPYSLGSPILTTPCGHSIGHQDYNLVEITRKQFELVEGRRLRQLKLAGYQMTEKGF